MKLLPALPPLLLWPCRELMWVDGTGKGEPSPAEVSLSVETSTGLTHADSQARRTVMWGLGACPYDPDFYGPSTAIWATVSSLFLCGA